MKELFAIPFRESFDNTNALAANHRIMFDLDDVDVFPPLAPYPEWQMVDRPHHQEQATSYQDGDWMYVDHPRRTFAQVAASSGSLNQPIAKSRFFCGLEHQTRKHVRVAIKKSGASFDSCINHNDNDDNLPDFELVYLTRKDGTAIKRRSTRHEQQRQFKLQETLLRPYGRIIKKQQIHLAARQRYYEAKLAAAEKHEKMEMGRKNDLLGYRYWLYSSSDTSNQREVYTRRLAHEIKTHDQKSPGIYSKCDTDEKVVDLYRKRLRESVQHLPPSQRHLEAKYYYLFPKRYHYLYYATMIPARLDSGFLEARDCREMLIEFLQTKVLTPARRCVEQYKSIIDHLKDDSIRRAVHALPKNIPNRRMKMSKVQYARAFITQHPL
ncbi:hypothetical protein O0I10_002284 [Lichtheimia ornata]|uniref:Uncharacterized protein n=1 Tax=Lichtheimia ornata TaxID=688661 RepID=A0AAD7V9P6_9FUNG|nr:uncharacterized protein O0I10_002284 [Lichtheimia ornata]KAJ8661953.1 hypothetical protein O0I10_002284 [Lichtheimia ornata]